ncbi:hypothetical protein BJP25_25310 [Actinokineospora bangkokensis]|uniref:Esterase n=1 Tax=Actinokineospora bangkokensis TaxID=1193682 RepID=A0A1Q9LIB0_9PSEU|nr:hypothetical protein BJP25_25310 [Actinokineospora bangkokensis]
MSRRAVLTLGAGLGAGLLAGCQREPAPTGTGAQLLAGNPTVPDTDPVITRRDLSTGRAREVDVVVMRPSGVPAQPMPVCVTLHGGKYGNAKSMVSLGLQQALTGLVKQTGVPFALAAVDGGNWVGDKDDDPQRMLMDDLPGWLDRLDLATTPFAALGVGEGGTGALTLARTPGLSAVAAISPTLFDTYADAAKSGIYQTRQSWEQGEPLRHTPQYANLPVGVWCGTDDRDFLATSREFAEKARGKLTTGPGGHDDAYYRRVLPDALKFVAGYL